MTAMHDGSIGGLSPEDLALSPIAAIPSIASSAATPSRIWGKRYSVVATCQQCGRCRKILPKTGLCSHCTTAESRAKAAAKPPKRRNRPQDVVPLGSKELISPHAYQTQMLSTFLDAHSPGRAASSSYLHMLTSIHLTPLMSEAVTTLCLSYLSQAHHDQSLVHASQRSYGRVLSQLKRAVEPASKHLYRPSEVIMSILIMRLYHTGDPAEPNHMVHSLGAAKYLESCGPSCLDPDRPLDHQLLKEIHLQTLMPAIALRENVIWGKPGWEAFESGGDVKYARFSWWCSWLSSFTPLPCLLQSADSVLAQPRLPQRLQRLVSIGVKLEAFRANNIRWMPDDNSAENVISVTDLKKFDLRIAEHRHIIENPVFTTHYVFPDFGTRFRSTISWVCCLVSDCTLLRIHYSEPGVKDLLLTSTAEVEARALRTATSLCASVHSYSRLDYMPLLLWVYVFVEVAKTFFEEAGATDNMKWCQGCSDAVQSHISRLRPLCRPTLCRVEQCAPALCEAMRYRSIHYSP